jgi:hypothetical protein
MKITKSRLKQIIKEQIEATLDEGAELKIPVETYDAFKKRFEQWVMLFDKFVGHAGTDMIHPDFQPKKEGTKYRKMLFKLSSELQDLMKQYKLQYKYYDDEKHKARKQLDTFGDHNSQYFIEEEGSLHEEIELDLTALIDPIFELIKKEIVKTPEETRNVVWSALMSKIAEAAKEGEGSELQDVAEVLDPDAEEET